jgi:hypothetical protein
MALFWRSAGPRGSRRARLLWPRCGCRDGEGICASGAPDRGRRSRSASG